MTSRWVFVCMVLAVLAPSAIADKSKSAKPAAPAQAAPAEAPAEAPSEAAAEGSAQDAIAAVKHIVGPKLVDLGHGAEIDLPAGMILFERAEAQDLVRKAGNDAEGVVAAIVPGSGTSEWAMLIEAQDVGYVSDDDAHELDADALLTSYKTGTLAQNKQRKAVGVAELFIDGWSERPHYDGSHHQLVWGLNAHDNDGKVINFFTRQLGRNGFLSLNLIDSPTTIEASKVEVAPVLTAIRFKPGSRYEDHTSDDKDSGMGLKALVLGGAGVAVAKKTGILVAILMFFKKGFIIVIAAIGAFFKRLFGRNKDNNNTYASNDASGPSDPTT